MAPVAIPVPSPAPHPPSRVRIMHLTQVGRLPDLLKNAALESGKSANTLRAYQRVWVALSVHCLQLNVTPEELSEPQAKELYEALTGGRGASVHLSVRAALSFAYTQLRAPNPFKYLLSKRQRPGQIEIRYLSAPELRRLFDALGAAAHRGGQAHYFKLLTAVLAELLYSTATRFHEWAQLERTALVYEEGLPAIARMQTKGGRKRDMVIPLDQRHLLKIWFEHLAHYRSLRARGGDTAFATSLSVFPGRNGRPISNQIFNVHLARACQRAQIHPAISAHCLRHTAATMLLNTVLPGETSSGSLRRVQEILGHAQLSTTARYAHVASDEVRRSTEALSSVIRIPAAPALTGPIPPIPPIFPLPAVPPLPSPAPSHP